MSAVLAPQRGVGRHRRVPPGRRRLAGLRERSRALLASAELRATLPAVAVLCGLALLLSAAVLALLIAPGLLTGAGAVASLLTVLIAGDVHEELVLLTTRRCAP